MLSKLPWVQFYPTCPDSQFLMLIIMLDCKKRSIVGHGLGQINGRCRTNRRNTTPACHRDGAAKIEEWPTTSLQEQKSKIWIQTIIMVPLTASGPFRSTSCPRNIKLSVHRRLNNIPILSLNCRIFRKNVSILLTPENVPKTAVIAPFLNWISNFGLK